MELIYHYTTVDIVSKINEAGELRVSGHTGALWLSKNRIWENSISYMISESGGRRFLSKQELHNLIGLVRYVLPFDPHRFLSVFKSMQYSPEFYYDMRKDFHANPDEWFTCKQNIPLKKCICCQFWTGRAWRTISVYNPHPILDDRAIFKILDGEQEVN